uniref:NADH-ubiquinone oxidoreductase chain 6 n=1 Tax=Rhagovelia reitteri TaxID=2581066 RepID=A0A5B9XWU3_9HEMI|nr:NADH dehydrogenase subunit 6 [Rhagovelia reitteri]QEH58858.1 NADH dehydrogenase subunit 6 [Rhagovelia reitteri]
MLLTLIMLTTLIIMVNHPLSMGFLLILQTITTAMIMNMIMKNSWYSYILTLIMAGGMLILFMYMASIASNEIMKFSLKMIMPAILIMMLFFMETENFMNFESNKMNLEMNQTLSLMKLFSTKSLIITILLALYLLMTMIYVISIINIFKGPMRMKN